MFPLDLIADRIGALSDRAFQATAGETDQEFAGNAEDATEQRFLKDVDNGETDDLSQEKLDQAAKARLIKPTDDGDGYELTSLGRYALSEDS